jgi:uncharacterized CHY-type Zn-finger protein
MSEDRLSAPCPRCHTEMIYVAALPHSKSLTMRKTTFVCYVCKQTRSYALFRGDGECVPWPAMGIRFSPSIQKIR